MQRRENTIKPQNVKNKQQKTDIKSLNTSREKENTNTNRRNTPNHDKIHEMKIIKIILRKFIWQWAHKEK